MMHDRDVAGTYFGVRVDIGALVVSAVNNCQKTAARSADEEAEAAVGGEKKPDVPGKSQEESHESQTMT